MSDMTMTSQTGEHSSLLWLWWALATGVAGFITGYLEGAFFQFLATLVLAGFIAGTAQWLVMRQRLAWWWIALTGIGWTLGMTVISQALDPITAPIINGLWNTLGLWEVFWLNAINLMVVGLVMSAAQLILLMRGQVINRAWAWIITGGVGGLLMGMSMASTCAAACDALATIHGLSTAVSMGAGWLVYGAITGLALQLLLKPISQRKVNPQS